MQESSRGLARRLRSPQASRGRATASSRDGSPSWGDVRQTGRFRRLALRSPPRAPVDERIGPGLEEPGQAVVIAARLDEADLGLEGLRMDQVAERHVREVELTLDAHHVA